MHDLIVTNAKLRYLIVDNVFSNQGTNVLYCQLSFKKVEKVMIRPDSPEAIFLVRLETRWK
jgi:hypothetical protein